ncbi:MAG: hypothetical protein ACE5FN_12450 [Leptospirillia bacterium]
MTLNLTIRIEDAAGADQAAKLLQLFKDHWNRAEAKVAAKTATETPAAEPTDEKPPTIEDARAALESVVGKHGMNEGLEIVRSYGVEKISELPADRYGDFITVCQEAAA